MASVCISEEKCKMVSLYAYTMCRCTCMLMHTSTHLHISISTSMVQFWTKAQTWTWPIQTKVLVLVLAFSWTKPVQDHEFTKYCQFCHWWPQVQHLSGEHKPWKNSTGWIHHSMMGWWFHCWFVFGDAEHSRHIFGSQVSEHTSSMDSKSTEKLV